ncbi:unnamed protein product, partial [Closterium sp. NIES-53]
AQPADPQIGAIAALETPPAPWLKEMAPPAAVPAPLQQEEQEPQAVEMDTVPLSVVLSRSQTPYPPRDEPTAGAYGSHEKQQMQREQEEEERLTGEEEVQAHRSQPEEGTHAPPPRPRPPHHPPRPPQMQTSSPETHGAEENRVAAAPSLARHVAQGSEADAASRPETADAEQGEQQQATQDQEPPGRPRAAPMSPQSVGQEPTAQRPPPPPLGLGRQWWRTWRAATYQRQQSVQCGRQRQAAQRGSGRPEGHQQRQGEPETQREHQEQWEQASQECAHEEQPQREVEAMRQVEPTLVDSEPRARREAILVLTAVVASLRQSPSQTVPAIYQNLQTQRQRALAQANLQSPLWRGRGRGRGQRVARGVGGGPENAFQVAGRRALTTINEDIDPEE